MSKKAVGKEKAEKQKILTEGSVSRVTAKLTVRLFALLILCAVMSISCFRYLMQWQTWTYIELLERGIIKFDAKKIIEELQEEAKDIKFQEVSEEELKELLHLEKYDDGYTIMHFYSGEDGMFQFTGITPAIWDSFQVQSFWYDEVGYYRGLDYTGNIEFQDTTETVAIYSMHQAQIVVPYFTGALIVSLLLFLPVVFYVRNRMKYVGKLKDEILIMADGDLEHSITVKGRDEIGILAENLNEMRLALNENIRREQEVKKSNHDLISSMSHDLRTPLTTLYGYLEIMERKKCPQEKQEEYIGRCIEKVEEIRKLSDKMFEYALVYEQNEKADLSEFYLEELLEELERNREFLELKGFFVHTDFKIEGTGTIMGNRIFFQRIFNNLFSNILKYADKRQEVYMEAAVEKGQLRISLMNSIKKETEKVESNRIGLKSVEKMVQLQEGHIFKVEDGEKFAVTIWFPLV